MAGLDDIAELKEWTDAIGSVIAFEGMGRADDLLTEVVATARRSGAKLPFAANTAYINTIPPDEEPGHPGPRAIEMRDPRGDPLERGGDRLEGQQGELGAWRPHRLVPVRGLCFTTPALPTSGMAPTIPRTAATSFTYRGTPRPGSMRAPFWRAVSARSGCSTSARKPTARASRPTRIPG